MSETEKVVIVGSGPAGFLISLGQSLDAQEIDRGFHIAVGFNQGFLGIHHAGARLVAQLLNLCRGNRHIWPPFSLIPRQNGISGSNFTSM